MVQYYKDLALKLYKKGYKPIPIRPKSKIPFMSQGESWQVDITEKQVQEWAANGKGAGGIALTGIGGLDFDIKEKSVSNALIKYIRENIQDNTPIRIGLAPKFLIPVSPESDIKKKWKNTWFDQSGEKHEIEFLSPGDQYFLVFGIHPDTKEEYKWVKNNSVLSIEQSELPVVDGIDLSGIEDKFDTLAKKNGWTRGENKKNNHPEGAEDFDLSDIKMGGEMADRAGVKELASWLKFLPTDWVDDRDNWITIGAALHHETGGSNEGWSIFDKWSQKSKKYKNRADTIKRWESFTTGKGIKDGRNCSTRGTIIHILKEAGVWEEAQKAGNKIRDEISAKTADKKNADNANDIVKKMNKKHAVIRIGSKVRIMNEGKSMDGGLDLGFLSVPDFNTMYSNKKTTDPFDPKKKKTLSKIWINDPCRREYKGIVFEPTGSERTTTELEGYYNIWKGLSVKPSKGDWGYFKDHIYEVIADGNESMGKWIIAWVARIVQQPGGVRPGTSIVLKGGQGIGKGVFVNTLGDFFGDHFLPVSHASQVAGRFNSHLTNKILVFIDEGFWAGDKKSEGVLKSIITEPYLAIEQKGVDIIRVKNNINLVMASNNDWVVPANIAERRFCVLDVSDKRQGDKPYFKQVMQQMYRKGGLQAMLYDLLKMDISDVDLGTFEQTKGLFEQKIHSMSTEMQYWYERLQEGDLLSERDDNNDYANSWNEVKNKEQYEDYLIFVDKMKERFPLSPTQFGIFIKKICPGIKVRRETSGTHREKTRKFQELAMCRSEFDKQFKFKIEWDTEDEQEELPF